MSLLHKRLETLEQWCQGKIGVAACHIQSMKTFFYNQNIPFLLCSTYKIPIAICLLQKVERKELYLNELVSINTDDLRGGVLSTLNQLSYSAPVQMSVLNLLQFMLQESCNTSTDIIIRLIGGPQAVMKMLHAIGILDLHVDRYILEILADWEGCRHLIPHDYRCSLNNFQSFVFSLSPEEKRLAKEQFKENKQDYGTAESMNALLIKLMNHQLLTPKNTQLLLDIMEKCKTGPNRLKGILPPQTSVSHKTGTLAGYVLDAGIVFLPHSLGEMTIAVFVKTNNHTDEASERVIAEVTRVIYDHFMEI